MGRHECFCNRGFPAQPSCRCYAYRALSAPMSACLSQRSAVMAGRGCVATATSQHGPSWCSAGTLLAAAEIRTPVAVSISSRSRHTIVADTIPRALRIVTSSGAKASTLHSSHTQEPSTTADPHQPPRSVILTRISHSATAII